MIIRNSRLLPMALAAAMLAGSVGLATAQTTSPAPANTANQPTGSLQQTHGSWRFSKLVGATVYNGQGDSVGTIDDMLLDSQGKVSNVVLSVGGFLGIGTKYVEVPFSELKFVPSKGNSATKSAASNTPAANGTTTTGMASTSTANGDDYSVVLPSVTKDSLTKMTGFNY